MLIEYLILVRFFLLVSKSIHFQSYFCLFICDFFVIAYNFIIYMVTFQFWTCVAI